MSTGIDPSILRRPSSQSNSVASCDIQREVLTGTEKADGAHLRRPGANKSKRLYASFTSSRTNASDHRLVNGKAAATRRASGKGGLFPFRSRNLCNETVSHMQHIRPSSIFNVVASTIWKHFQIFDHI